MPRALGLKTKRTTLEYACGMSHVARGVTQGSPFQRHDLLVERLRGFFTASPLAVTRKTARLTPGQFGKIVESMFFSGFAM